ncbi:ATP-dependent helicase [Candidatus Saccharibacteria bacterium]|nr:ATP-dependent helicase [Candidatus Saccharibacteria bacterium]
MPVAMPKSNSQPSAFDRAYTSLNSDQRAAVDYIDGPLLVIAGPGTGKTQLLSVRVANILKQTDASPENILCLTFTETGATNMRNRLADFIGPEAYKVQIQTYHAFGSYVLQEHRPDLSTAIDDLDRFTIIRHIQSTLEPTDILKKDRHTKPIISAIADLKASALNPDDIQKIAHRNQTDNALILSAIEASLEKINARYPANLPAYREILATLETFLKPSEKIEKIEPLAHIYYRSLATILATLDNNTASSEKTPSIATPLRKWRDKYFRKDANDRYIFNDTVANKKLLSLANIMRLYTKHIQNANLFDYNDMILEAIKLLETNLEARYNLQERFQYILLDEYQDTNDAQLKLVNLLADNPTNNGKPNLMAVGDDDQAIYGFQGANTSNFFDFNNTYHPHHIFLTKNYRSSAPILSFAHNIIEQSEDRFCKSPSVNIDKRITSENPPNNTLIELREYPAYQAEYSHIATKIAELIASGTSANQIAIIAPKHKYLISILPYLHAKKIPVSYQHRENILDTPQIRTLQTVNHLLLALANSPASADPYWFEILSLPCWQLQPKTIVLLIQSAHKNRQSILEQIYADDNPAITTIADFFVSLSAKTTTFSADYIINALIVKLFSPNFPDTNQPNSDSKNPDQDIEIPNITLYSNLNTLRDLIRSKSSQTANLSKPTSPTPNNSSDLPKKYTLADFQATLDAYVAADYPILDQSPYHESDDAVKLQTVHSAKGLEYDHVFLISADNKNWSDAKGNNDQITLPRNLEFVRHTGDSIDEKLRVLFVAITRARSHLYLSYSLSDFAGHHSDRLKFLDLRDHSESNETTSSILPEPYHKLIKSNHASIEPSALSTDKWLALYMPDNATRKNLLRPSVERYKISPTHLNTFLDLTYGDGPISFLQRYLIGVPSPESFSLYYGKFIHEVMDEFNRENLKNTEVLPRYLEKVRSADLDDANREDLIKRGTAELPKFIAAKGDFLRSVKAESEYNFNHETITMDDVVLTGKIDRIEIDDAAKTIVVSDFKTGSPKTKWEDSILSYKIQLYFYKFLVENSHKFRNYRVISGRLDYIPADDYDQIVSLPLKFTDKDANDIKHLIKTVFHHIKTLDFPDTSFAKTHNNPTKAFYNQLISETTSPNSSSRKP